MNTLIPGAPLRSLSPTSIEYQRAQGASRAAKPARAARFTLDAPEHSGTIPGAIGDILPPGVALTSNLAVIFTLNQYTSLRRSSSERLRRLPRSPARRYSCSRRCATRSLPTSCHCTQLLNNTLMTEAPNPVRAGEHERAVVARLERVPHGQGDAHEREGAVSPDAECHRFAAVKTQLRRVAPEALPFDVFGGEAAEAHPADLDAER